MALTSKQLEDFWDFLARKLDDQINADADYTKNITKQPEDAWISKVDPKPLTNPQS